MSVAGDIARSVGPYPDPVFVETDEAAAALARVESILHSMAMRYGIPPRWYGLARVAFSRAIQPHAGKKSEPIKLSHWKRWWKGYAAALRDVGEVT